MLQLPSELIHKISLLATHDICDDEVKSMSGRFVCDRASRLASLSLVCQRVRAIVAPVLFERLSFKLYQTYLGPGESDEIKETLMQYPDVCLHVR